MLSVAFTSHLTRPAVQGKVKDPSMAHVRMCSCSEGVLNEGNHTDGSKKLAFYTTFSPHPYKHGSSFSLLDDG